MTKESRFQSKWTTSAEHSYNGSPCWEWLGEVGGWGYGRFWVEGKRVLAHRWSFENYIGNIPEGYEVDHLCRVRHCVNPVHLDAVTKKVNILRGEGCAAVNARKTHCPAEHLYDDVNTAINSRGARTCKKCSREKARRNYAAKHLGEVRKYKNKDESR